jgi:hypothetical protein
VHHDRWLQEFGAEILWADLATIAQRDYATNEIAEFPYVAGPALLPKAGKKVFF